MKLKTSRFVDTIGPCREVKEKVKHLLSWAW